MKRLPSIATLALLGFGCGPILGIHDLTGDASSNASGSGGAGAQGGGTATGGGTGGTGGACDRDCLGGPCEDGACKPVEIAKTKGKPSGLGLDAKNVYWADEGNGANGQVVQQAKVGGDTLILADALPSPRFIAVGSGVFPGVHFALADSILRVKPDSPGADTVESGLDGVFDLEVNEAALFWFQNDASVWVREESGKFPMVSGGSEVTAIEVDNQTLFWITPTKVERQILGTLNPLLVSGGEPRALGLAANRLLWSDKSTSKIRTSAPDGSDIQSPADATAVLDLDADDTYVYWATQSSVTKKRLDGTGESVVVATVPGFVGFVKVDDQYAFFAATDGFTGTIHKVAK
jgi:hypothetical protein